MKDEITFYTHFTKKHTNPATVVALVIFSILLIILVSMNGIVYVRRRKAKRNFNKKLNNEYWKKQEEITDSGMIPKDIKTGTPIQQPLLDGEGIQEDIKLSLMKQQQPPILSNPMAEINQAHLYPDSMADLYNTVP